MGAAVIRTTVVASRYSRTCEEEHTVYRCVGIARQKKHSHERNAFEMVSWSAALSNTSFLLYIYAYTTQEYARVPMSQV